MLQKQLESRKRAAELASARARKALEAKLLEQAQSDEAKLAAADLARDEEQFLLASKIYLQLSLSRVGDVSEKAKGRLDDMKQKGRERLAALEQRTGPSSDINTILAALDEFEQLQRQFARVPAVNREIQSQFAKKRRRPEFVAAAREPEAAELVAIAEKHAADDQVCCAVLVYEQAAMLAPAPSALQAAQRLEILKQQPATVAAAEACRQLQWCHNTYDKAKRIARRKPVEARDLYAQILDKAPIDSEIFRAARQEMFLLKDAG